MVEHQAHPAVGLEVLVHHHPGRQVEAEAVVKDGHEVRVAPRDSHLHGADAESGAHGGELRHIAVAAQGEEVGRDWNVDLVGDGLERCEPVEADQAVLEQVVHRVRRAVAFEIAPMGVERDPGDADPAGQQRLLRRLRHPHGDIGVTVQKILHRVGQGQLDGDSGIGLDNRKLVAFLGEEPRTALSTAIQVTLADAMDEAPAPCVGRAASGGFGWTPATPTP